MEHPDFTPAASCVPGHVVYTNVRSGEEQSARRINYKADTVDNLPCSILQRAAPKQKIMSWGGKPGPREPVDWATALRDSSPQTSRVVQNSRERLDSTQDQHAEKQ